MTAAMEEYAIVVYTLVEHALHFDAEAKLWDIMAARMVNAQPRDAKRFMNRLQRATDDILEQEDYDINKIKRIFNG